MFSLNCISALLYWMIYWEMIFPSFLKKFFVNETKNVFKYLFLSKREKCEISILPNFCYLEKYRF